MKKILHIPNYYPPHIGGIEDVCRNIISITPEFDHKVICFNDMRKTRIDSYEGVEVIRCGVLKKSFSQSISFAFLKELNKVFRRFDPDIVHFHAPNPWSSILLRFVIPDRVKLIVHWHSDIIEQKFLYSLYRLFEKRMLERADKILVTSPYYFFGSKTLAPWKDKIQIIQNTVQVSKLKKQEEDDEEIRKIRMRFGEKKIIFTFGRHVPYKGLKYLIRALPLIRKDAVVLIAGQGPLTPQLKKMASSPAVFFLGRLSDDELRCYLHASDVFAFPSITRNEAFGIALAEAMYCGLPSVTFKIPHSGVNWVCPGGTTGLEVPNRNALELVLAINRLLQDQDLRHRLGTEASRRVRILFSPHSIRMDLVTLYENE